MKTVILTGVMLLNAVLYLEGNLVIKNNCRLLEVSIGNKLQSGEIIKISSEDYYKDEDVSIDIIVPTDCSSPMILKVGDIALITNGMHEIEETYEPTEEQFKLVYKISTEKSSAGIEKLMSHFSVQRDSAFPYFTITETPTRYLDNHKVKFEIIDFLINGKSVANESAREFHYGRTRIKYLKKQNRK